GGTAGTTLPVAEDCGAREPTPAVPPSRRPAPLDVDSLRADFPILATTVRGRPLVYLDSAATSQKPRCVIDAERRYYEAQNANIHRGVYQLSADATLAYDRVREQVARFLGAASPNEVVFTRGTTEAINLVAQTWGRANLAPGDEVLLTTMEHHSNIVPWQLVAEQTGARVVAAPITDAGELDLAAFERLLTERVKLVGIVHVSNALGTINPVEAVVRLAHARGIPVLVDGAQSAPHLGVDVQALGCDFFVCSAHKMLGPTGVGLLWAREALLERMPPWQGGGDMIQRVSFERSTWAPVPQKFEAGTPNIAGVVAFGAALAYLERVGLAGIAAHEDALLAYATARVAEVPGLRVVGTAAHKASVLSFVMEGAHPHDIGTILDGDGIAIRAGHHCAQPLMRRLGVPATARASFALYNTADEVDALVRGLQRVREVLG
ncbi:MAG TPA: cysteine desulfurase, partial [Gemmatimonadales bacterium]|nr:cysteine desulfurase [Gemmatimonadales bacterium]